MSTFGHSRALSGTASLSKMWVSQSGLCLFTEAAHARALGRYFRLADVNATTLVGYAGANIGGLSAPRTFWSGPWCWTIAGCMAVTLGARRARRAALASSRLASSLTGH